MTQFNQTQKMKQTQMIKLLALGILLSLTAVGCQSTRYGVTPLGDKPNKGNSTDSANKSEVAQIDEPVLNADGLAGLPETRGHEGWKENADLFKSYRVHFDYDSSVVNAAEREKLAVVAEQLKSNPAIAVKIEGHCDERGTEEYNRALGERRALALRVELINLGIDPTRLDTISYADNKPLVEEHGESAYRQNRRGEFVALSPQ
jgi:peptidoglycan-associated lipoprotein